MVKEILQPPSQKHLMGTDELGRDVLTRIIWGSRVSLLIGFVAVGISVAIGILLGSLAGYYGGSVDSIIMRFVDVMLCFPRFFLFTVIAFWSQYLENYDSQWFHKWMCHTPGEGGVFIFTRRIFIQPLLLRRERPENFSDILRNSAPVTGQRYFMSGGAYLDRISSQLLGIGIHLLIRAGGICLPPKR
jgi:ABC-type dipeptide/oligopeptide/nickel transport system permease component